jgi:hypothetical protein
MLRRHWLVGIFCASLGISIGCQGNFEAAGVNDPNATSNEAGSPSLRALRFGGFGRRLNGSGGQAAGTSGTGGAGTGGMTVSQSGGAPGTGGAATGGTTVSQSGGAPGTATGGTTVIHTGGTPGTAGAGPGTGSTTPPVVSGGTGGSTGASGSCGNGKSDPGESCDGADLQNATCAGLGFSGGSLACSSSCQFNVSSCTGGTITPTVTASRTTCTAPCGVFFDATATSGLSGSNYWRASWTWDFNDPTSTHKGTVGFVVAHVFDNPGTYRVVTRVHDLAGNAGSATTTITVNPMSGGTTYYVASNGSDSNSGTDMAHPLLTATFAISKHYATNNAILFRRGDTFAIDGVRDFNYLTAGPFLMSAYTDPGAPSTKDPILTSAQDTSHGEFNVAAPDLRFQHLHLVATSGLGSWFSMTNGGNQALVEYVEMEGQGTSGDETINAEGVSNTFVVDNYMHDFNAYGMYAGGCNNAAVIGNRIINFSGGTSSPLHGVRLNATTSGTGTANSNYYMADNTITVGPTGQIFTAFTIHGDVQHVVVVGNTVDHDCGVGPTNTSVVEKPNGVLFEGNVMARPASNVGYVALAADASQMEIRNNLLVNADRAVVVGNSYPLMPANWPDQVFVENNTGYQNPPAGQPNNYAVYFGYHQFTTGAATFLNNIFWEGMTANGSRMIGADGKGTETVDYNLIYSPNVTLTSTNVGGHGMVGDPKFVSMPAHSSDPITASGFALQAGSPAIDTGTSTHDYEDLYRVGRAQNATMDLGAFEFRR